MRNLKGSLMGFLRSEGGAQRGMSLGAALGGMLRVKWDRAVNAAARALIAGPLKARSRVIPHAEAPDEPLLTQALVLHWGALSIYLQHFETPEAWEYFHRHRWAWMRSIVLSGYYVEERPGAAPESAEFGYMQSSSWAGASDFLAHKRGDTFALQPSTIHRVSVWSPECWTLFLTWRPSDDWGYYARADGEFIPWREFVQRRVASLETGLVAP